MPRFQSININGLGEAAQDLAPRLRAVTRVAVQGLAEPGERAAPNEMLARLARATPESAGRQLLQTYLEDAGDALRAITAPDRPEVAPDMLARAVVETPALGASSVSFQQFYGSIPIFGSRVVVDVDADDRSMVAINGKVTPPPERPGLPRLNIYEAFAALTEWGGSPKLDMPANPPVLTWYLDEESEAWHLVYHFAGVRMRPRDDDPLSPEDRARFSGACVRHALAADESLYDYFVDASDGQVVFYFATTARLDVPSPMKGQDCGGIVRDFYGLAGNAGYLLSDPLRNIQTFDYQWCDIDQRPQPPLPASPIGNATHDLGNSAPAAVSAHYHAQLVYDFYNNVLKRDGIDDKGMMLISVVNTYSSYRNPDPPPEWGNAVWSQNKMWYGQEGGVSFAKYLDIIGHELTHGVTGTTSNLIYRRLPGALNESFSDIFGVIIANWYPAAPNPIATWSWEIGPGLGTSGGPIRDFSNPARTGQPDHMSQYAVWPVSRDQGGVHFYSGIHNKAVYNLLTGRDPNGQLSFPTAEAVLMIYFTLTRLTPTSDFLDSRRTLENVCGVYYGADATLRAARLAAVATAYDAVGIL